MSGDPWSNNYFIRFSFWNASYALTSPVAVNCWGGICTREPTACDILVRLSNYFSIYTPSHWENNSLQESYSQNSLTFCHAFICNQPVGKYVYASTGKINTELDLFIFFSFNYTVNPLLMPITCYRSKGFGQINIEWIYINACAVMSE